MKIELRQKDTQKGRCAYCHDDLDDTSFDVTHCRSCDAVQHIECWIENEKCSSCGHARSTKAREIERLLLKKRFHAARQGREATTARRRRPARETEPLRWRSTAEVADRNFVLFLIIHCIFALIAIYFLVFYLSYWPLLLFVGEAVFISGYYLFRDVPEPNATTDHLRERIDARRRQASLSERILSQRERGSQSDEHNESVGTPLAGQQPSVMSNAAVMNRREVLQEQSSSPDQETRNDLASRSPVDLQRYDIEVTPSNSAQDTSNRLADYLSAAESVAEFSEFFATSEDQNSDSGDSLQDSY